MSNSPLTVAADVARAAVWPAGDVEPTAAAAFLPVVISAPLQLHCLPITKQGSEATTGAAMGLFSLSSTTAVSSIPSSSSRRSALTEKPTSFFDLPLSIPSKSKGHMDARSSRLSVLVQVATELSPQPKASAKLEISSKDSNLAFVGGATGRVGSRTVRELLKLGFRVRAGVRSAQRAEALVQSVKQMKLDGASESLGTQPGEKLEIVECDLENESSIAPAIGNASIIICCIGASEKEVFDLTGPYRIDYKATKNLIEAATVAKVDHFILLTSLGTNKIGFPASILNLFWGVLCWKRRAEEALISSGLPYTIVRPGGMERPTDSYKETHNIVLANEDTYFGGQVSNLQVAELMAFMAKHRKPSFCKVVEVIAETTAPLTPLEELLAKIPSKRVLSAEPQADPVPLAIESETSSDVVVELSTVEPPKADIHSPFTMYEDLKPPTSPTPTPSTAATAVNNGPAIAPSLPGADTGSNVGGTTPSNVNEEEVTLSSSYRSPYFMYDDLKPPTTPTPSKPSTSSLTALASAAGSAGNSTPANSEAPPEDSKASRPLSPYAMYEDLMPPSSPRPSVPTY